MRDARSPSCPSLTEYTVLGLASLVILEQHSRLPEANFIVLLICGVAIVGVGVTYFIRIRTHSHDTPARAASFQPRLALSWLIYPATIALLLLSASTHWPATVRFYFSRPNFNELITRAYQGERPEGFPRRVGLYWVEYIYDADFNYETREGTIGFVTGVALIDECGIYYDSSNRPSSHYLTTRIAPRWYLTEW